MIKGWKSAILGSGMLALSAGVASAAPAIVDRDSNFRTGPGMQFSSQMVLPAGTMINVLGCQGGWCAAQVGPHQGYIGQRLIVAAAPGPAPRAFARGPYAYAPGPYAAAPFWGPPALFGIGLRVPGAGLWVGI